MVGGFNTNVRYRGRTFHVQTEDSGPNVAKIVTLLYEGGTILFSRKTAYGKEPESSSREAVRARMEQQHCEMVEGLKAGEFDADVGFSSATPKPQARGAPRADSTVKDDAEPATPSSRVLSIEPRKHRTPLPRPAAMSAEDERSSSTPERPRRAASEAPIRDFGHGVISQKPLDEVVLALLAVK